MHCRWQQLSGNVAPVGISLGGRVHVESSKSPEDLLADAQFLLRYFEDEIWCLQFQDQILQQLEKGPRDAVDEVRKKLNEVANEGVDAVSSVVKFSKGQVRQRLFGMFDEVLNVLYEDLRTLIYPDFLGSAHGREARDRLEACGK